MKNTIISSLLTFGFFINAALAGNSAKIGYASDFFYRGDQKSVEAVQASVDLSAPIAGLTGSLHACTNQSLEAGATDSYRLAAGVSKSVGELFTLYGGFNHFEDVAGEALSEIQIALSIDVLGSPTVSAYRNTSDDLYTFEGSLSHSIDLQLANLELRGSLGSTEVSDSDSRTYYSVGAGLSRALGDASLSAYVDLVDSDDIDREFVFSTALSFNF